jgi:aryl sulfotransferase
MRHQPPGEDSDRWLGFRFRPGDIVISTPRKSGTTWMQMICALLIFQTPDLPDPLWRLSPWLDGPAAPKEHVYAQLAGQRHRRFIKTHTPLGAIPSESRVTYIVTARHPLDALVSLYHQDHIIGRPPMPPPTAPKVSREELHEVLVQWIASDEPLSGYLRHLSDAWTRRGEPNVLLVRYDDLLTDLEGQMRWLAGRLGIAVPEQSWPVLAGAATFERMKARNDILVPPPPGIVADTALFFRRGRSGAAREILSDEEMASYHARAARLAPPDMVEWLHRETDQGRPGASARPPQQDHEPGDGSA